MNLYKYRYVDKSGMTLRGEIKASSKSEALAKLTDVAELQYFKDCGVVPDMPAFIKKHLKPKKVAPTALAGFFDQMSYMISAGISIQNGLMIQRSSAEGPLLSLINELLKEMSYGKSFAQAFEACGHLIQEDYSKFIYVGEQGGNLDVTLERLAKQIESGQDVKSKIKGALVYPVGTLVVALGAAYFIFTTIIPQIAEILKDLGDGELPTLTKITMAISDFLIQYGPFFVVAMVILGYVVNKIVHKYFQYQLDVISLRLPLMGDIIRTGQFITFYQNLSFMLESGFSPTESFKASNNAVTNRYLNKQLEYAYTSLVQGKTIPQALSTLECVYPLEIQTIDVGISTGKIQELLGKLVKNMQKHMDALIKNMLSAMEPLLMCVLAVVVGVLMLAVYGPMFSMMQM